MFKLYLKQGYHVTWNVEKVQKVKSPMVAKTNKERIMVLLKCVMYNSKRSRFMKN